MIITRQDMSAVALRALTGQVKSISNMLLSQPPCLALECSVWDERDESKEYIGRTRVLNDSVIRDEKGVTMSMVHESVQRMFDEHRDVSAIKLTTI